MKPAIVETFARSIFAKAQLLRSAALTTRERRRVSEAVSDDIRKYTDLIEHGASVGALSLATEMGISLIGMGWHDQHKFDPGRQRFILEHVIPVKTVRDRCLSADSELDVARQLDDVRVAWILRDENARLNALGYASNRPDPREAYRQAGISLPGYTDNAGLT